MKYKIDYFGYVYLWYDKFRKKFCLGSHYGDVNDNYTSSTGNFKYAYKKRPQDFKMRVLEFLIIDDKRLLLEIEYKWLQKIKPEELKTKYYNRKLSIGGCGGSNKGNKNIGGWNKGVTGEMLMLRKNGLFCLLLDKKQHDRNVNRNKGRIVSEEAKSKMSKARMKYFKNPKNRQNISTKNKGRKRKPKTFKYKTIKVQYNLFRIPWNVGLMMSEEQKKKLSNNTKGRKAWNKGIHNPHAANNGRNGAAKQSINAKGRRKKYNPDGTWSWSYPN